MKNKFKLFIICAAVICLAFLCACGSQSAATQTAQPAASAPIQTQAPVKKTPAPEESEPLTEDDALDDAVEIMARRGETATTVMKDGNETIDGEACWTFAAGTTSADGKKFTAMYHYAVSTTGRAWYMDISTGNWVEFNMKRK